MTSLALECGPREQEHLVAELYEAGTDGIQEEELPDGRCRLRAFFEEGSLAEALAARFAEYSPALQEEEARDWVAVARAQWEPQLAGEKFFLVPAWRDDPAPPGRIRLTMPAGTAAGTGLHPATQLALAGLERTVKPGDRVLDLGTGSGILAAAAHLLGAGRVTGCDIDVEAIGAAREYTREMPIFLYAGSTRSIASRSMDVVAANLNMTTLLSLGAEIARVLREGGRVVLTGFPLAEAAPVHQAIEPRGLPLREVIEQAGWVCLVCELKE